MKSTELRFKLGDRVLVPRYQNVENVPGTIRKYREELGWNVVIDEWWKYAGVNPETIAPDSKQGNGWWDDDELIPFQETGDKSGLEISFAFTLPQLEQGVKTTTRRDWKDSHAAKFIKAFREGLSIKAVSKDRRAGGQQIGWLKLTQEPYKQAIEQMSEADLVVEGGMCSSVNEFCDSYFEGDLKKEVWVINFEFKPLHLYQKDSQNMTATSPIETQIEILDKKFKVGDCITDGYGIAEVIEVTEEGMRINWLGKSCCPNLSSKKYNFPSGQGLWQSWKRDKRFVDKYGLYYPEIFSVNSRVELNETYFNRPQGSTGTVLALPDPEHPNSPHCMCVRWDEKQSREVFQELVPIKYLKPASSIDIEILDEKFKVGSHITDGHSLDDALLQALNADTPTWERLKDTGASDAELQDAIASAFGIASGSSVPIDWTAKGGKNPRFWAKAIAMGTPDFEGRTLVEKVRLLLGISNQSQSLKSSVQKAVEKYLSQFNTPEYARIIATTVQGDVDHVNAVLARFPKRDRSTLKPSVIEVFQQLYQNDEVQDFLEEDKTEKDKTMVTTTDSTQIKETEIVDSSITLDLDDGEAGNIVIEFSYDLVDNETRDFLQEKARNIKKLDRRYLEDTIDSGKDLIAVKERLRHRYGHGYFMGWLKLEFPYSHEIARIRMNAARRFEGIEIPTELDFAPKVIRILSSPARDEDQEALLKQAIEEVKNRVLAGQAVTHKDAQQIVDDFKGKIADKIYIYTGKPTQGTIGGTGETINLLPKSLVYPATISLTDPTQIFVRLLESPHSAVQVKREDLELKSLCGWEVGDQAKLLSTTKNKPGRSWIGEEVEVKSLEDACDNINVVVLKQPHIHLEVKPDQLSRDIGSWRDASGLFWVDSAPPKGHESKYVRIDTLPTEEQLDLSNQRILKCEKSITDYRQHQSKLTPSSGRWKEFQKSIEKLEAEIKREREYQSLLNPDSVVTDKKESKATKEKASNSSVEGSAGQSPCFSKGTNTRSEGSNKEPQTIEDAIDQCGFKIGDWVEDMSNGDKGIIENLQGLRIGSSKEPYDRVDADVLLDSGYKIQLQIHFLRLVSSWEAYGYTWHFDAEIKVIQCLQLYWELSTVWLPMNKVDGIDPNQTPSTWLDEWMTEYRDRWRNILFSNNEVPLEWRNNWAEDIASVGHVRFTYRPGYKDEPEVLRPFLFEVFRAENNEDKFAEFQVELNTAYEYSRPEDWFKDRGLKMLSAQGSDITSLALVTSARQMDAYVDRVGWADLAHEWGKATPEERFRIHKFYPGLRAMTKSYLGEQMWKDVQRVDELYFSVEDAVTTSSLLQDSLMQCETESQVRQFIEVNPVGAADEILGLSWRERNHLRQLAWGFDKLLCQSLSQIGKDSELIQGLLLRDRDTEIDHLKSEVEALNTRNLELEELNGDLNLRVTNLEEQLNSHLTSA